MQRSAAAGSYLWLSRRRCDRPLAAPQAELEQLAQQTAARKKDEAAAKAAAAKDKAAKDKAAKAKAAGKPAAIKAL